MVIHTDYVVLTPDAPISTRIWFMRDKRRMSQTHVAKAVNVNVATVRRWEKGECEPYPYQVENMAKLFKVNTDWLMTGQVWG